VGRANGLEDAKLAAVHRHADSDLFDARERAALLYADRITVTDEDVDDEQFADLRSLFSDEQLVELTCTVAFENFLSKLHHALLVDSQGFCPVAPALPAAAR
jgi:alkylhydroperoxidase family enzyme